MRIQKAPKHDSPLSITSLAWIINFGFFSNFSGKPSFFSLFAHLGLFCDDESWLSMIKVRKCKFFDTIKFTRNSNRAFWVFLFFKCFSIRRFNSTDWKKVREKLIFKAKLKLTTPNFHHNEMCLLTFVWLPWWGRLCVDKHFSCGARDFSCCDGVDGCVYSKDVIEKDNFYFIMNFYYIKVSFEQENQSSESFNGKK